MNPTIDKIGVFPVSGPESRERKEFYHLSDKESLHLISGEKTPALLSLWCSNDFVHFGTIRLLSGGPCPQQTEYDSHKGDAVFYVKKGPMTFFIRDRKETYDVREGDYMFIPEGETYKIINYYGHTAEAVFAVAPEL